MHIQNLKPWEVVFEQGDEGDSFYIIYSGKVAVYVDSTDPVTEEKTWKLIVELNQGKYFGELALLKGEKWSATIIAVEPTDLIVLDKVTYDKIIKGA